MLQAAAQILGGLSRSDGHFVQGLQDEQQPRLPQQLKGRFAEAKAGTQMHLQPIVAEHLSASNVWQ